MAERSLDVRRDNRASPPRGSATRSATPPRWPTARDFHARSPSSQSAYARRKTRTPRPGSQGDHSEPVGAPLSQAPLEVGRAKQVSNRRVGFRFPERAKYPFSVSETGFRIAWRELERERERERERDLRNWTSRGYVWAFRDSPSAERRGDAALERRGWSVLALQSRAPKWPPANAKGSFAALEGHPT